MRCLRKQIVGIWSGAVLCGCLVGVAAPRAQEVTNRPALLQLTDGSTLHGSLSSILKEEGLAWKHPAARAPLQLLLTNVAAVRFERAQALNRDFKPSCRFYFKNGDEVAGNLLSMQNGQASLESWFGKDLHASIAALDSITFSAKGYRLLYEGPSGTDGWRIGRNPRSWEYKDGAFVANGADLLGRDFGLSGSAALEFDLEWNGSFSLSITLYAQAIDRFDYGTSAYLLYIGNGSVSVQRVQAGSGATMLGQASVPDMARRNKMRFEVRCNKDDATIAVLADGVVVQRWKDSGGFVAKGSGIVFFSQVEAKSLTLSNIRVAEWDGKFEPDSSTNAPTDVDVIFLANRDRVTGKVQSVEEGKVSIETKLAKLSIPMARVTQVQFAAGPPSTNQAGAMPEVRALFPGGEGLSFELHRWEEGQVTGTSRTFGDLSFDPKSIRQLQFSPGADSPLKGSTKAAEPEFPEFPEFE